MNYKSAHEAVHNLCESHPSKTFRYGVAKTVGGLVLLGIGAASVAVPFVDVVPDLKSPNQVIDGLAFVEGLAALGLGAYLLVDGVRSLARPLVGGGSDAVCYHNGGFINVSGNANRRFFEKTVTPVERMHDLAVEGGLMFINDVNFEFIHVSDGHKSVKATRLADLKDCSGPYSVLFRMRDNGRSEMSVNLEKSFRSLDEVGDFWSSMGARSSNAYVVVRKAKRSLDSELLFVGDAVRA